MNPITEKHKYVAVACLMKQWSIPLLAEFLAHCFPQPTEGWIEKVALEIAGIFRESIPPEELLSKLRINLQCASKVPDIINVIRKHYTAKGEES